MTPSNKREIVQIAFETKGSSDEIESILHALADDGTVWYYRHGKWNIWGVGGLPAQGSEFDKKENE